MEIFRKILHMMRTIKKHRIILCHVHHIIYYISINAGLN